MTFRVLPPLAAKSSRDLRRTQLTPAFRISAHTATAFDAWIDQPPDSTYYCHNCMPASFRLRFILFNTPYRPIVCGRLMRTRNVAAIAAQVKITALPDAIGRVMIGNNVAGIPVAEFGSKYTSG